MAWKYPSVRRDGTVKEDYGGTEVADPYRWLEDPDGEETRAFVKAQNDISEPYLASCPAREKFHMRYKITGVYGTLHCVLNSYSAQPSE